MTWRRLGLLYCPDGTQPLLATHAALPVAVPVDGGDLVRVFFSGRDVTQRSSVGTLLVQLGENPKVVDVTSDPVLVPGIRGTFDDAGVSVGCVVADPAGDRLYYMGWNVGGAVPWRNAIGLAVGDARGGRFSRFSEGPIMDRDPIDPFTLSYPWVLRKGPQDWWMWYGTNLAWGAAKSDMHHVIRTAWSADGIVWRRRPEPIIRPENDQIAVVRPTVLALDGELRMWFACRGFDAYRLGYASSKNWHDWARDDSSAGIVPQSGGWEADAVTYPCVFKAAGEQWLLYNGAGYGATGFGLAVWEG
jgi:hypothetical protein